MKSLGQQVYEAAQTVWHLSPYYKKWDSVSPRTHQRFNDLADALVDAGLIKDNDD